MHHTLSSSRVSVSRDDTAISNEINLLELLVLLWRKKLTIGLFTFSGLAAALIYVFTAEPKWTSVAYVHKPRLEQVSAYLDQRRAMARVDGNKPVDTAALTQTLFNRFISLAVAKKNRIEFLATTDYYKQLLAKNDSDFRQRFLLHMMARENLKVISVDKNQIAPYFELSFSANSPETAQRVLRDYLDWINTLAFRMVDEEFNDELNAQLLSRETELANIEFSLKTQRENRVAQLEAALHSARLAGLKDYIVGRNIDGNTVIELSDARHLFMLGENYLMAELETARTTPLIYPPRYYEMKRELRELQPLRKYEVKTLSYDYQLAPTLPLRRDRPRRLPVVLLGMTVGAMLGGFWVLGRMAIARSL
ncbi:LPS O-antigen chain length determinant protein WzzB [Allopusillimonas ginsengisoli]|uniref:LPS O-antigen chain length determinant protein WzzB n=1 Tax=Allopusillimonas ginsengisoli TaxID=453575 RepID=UPI0039C1476C